MLALGLVLVNTCVYAQPKNILPSLENALVRKGAGVIRTSQRIPHLAKIAPGSTQTVSPYTLPRQRFTVLGNMFNGTFIMDPPTDTRKVISQRPCHREDWWAWEDKLFGKLPRKFVESKFILFRGMSINNLAELENLLRNGSQVNETHYDAVYFSSDPSDAFHYMKERVRATKGIPVLITVKSSYDLDYEPIDTEDNFPSNHFHSFDTDIPATQQEVFVYLYYNGKDDWYHVSLTSQGKIITKRLAVYIKEQKATKQAESDNTNVETDLSEGTSPTP